MKVTIRRQPGGGYTVYAAKKDLESAVVKADREYLWGGTVQLANGWSLALPDLAPDTHLPVTVDARRIDG